MSQSPQVTKSVMSLLNYYGWNKFSIIYEEAWEEVAESLGEQAKSWNKTINHKKPVVDRHKCCENNMDCCRPGYWYNVSCPSIRYFILFGLFSPRSIE
jgi:guanylate cyclase, other